MRNLRQNAVLPSTLLLRADGHELSDAHLYLTERWTFPFFHSQNPAASWWGRNFVEKMAVDSH